jgi:protein-S-isoprenylcysteine O-methyltransferase Ste14
MNLSLGKADFPWLVLCYGGVFAAATAALSKRLDGRDARRAGRAAWCAAWLGATLVALLEPWGSWPPVNLSCAFVAAAWTAAAAAWAELARRPATAIAIWSLAVAGVGVAVGRVSSLPVGLALAVAVAFGGLVERAMRRAAWLPFRLAAYWASFVGTFAVLVPIALSTRDQAPRWCSAPHAAPIAAVLLLAAIPLAVAGTRALVAAGGTPEPLDPPTSLSRAGIYTHLRHPIQLAEILVVGSGAVLVGTRASLAFFALFSCALAGPIRLLEERALVTRFGTSAAEYLRACPAFIPRGWGGRKPDSARRPAPLTAIPGSSLGVAVGGTAEAKSPAHDGRGQAGPCRDLLG